ncbi:MAG: helix-turn-helix transcriptional regulator [Gemmatimonadetes bacterium]|nr:helix-turn-helix transcriptional regulator [Gemmatimonadota bacterium]
MPGHGSGDSRPPTSASFLILLALADGPLHGLGIAEDVARSTGGSLGLGPGTLYTTLHRLLDTGLIEESPDRPEPDADDPRRRYYRITSRGRRRIASEAASLDALLGAVRAKGILPSGSGS